MNPARYQSLPNSWIAPVARGRGHCHVYTVNTRWTSTVCMHVCLSVYICVSVCLCFPTSHPHPHLIDLSRDEGVGHKQEGQRRELFHAIPRGADRQRISRRVSVGTTDFQVADREGEQYFRDRDSSTKAEAVIYNRALWTSRKADAGLMSLLSSVGRLPLGARGITGACRACRKPLEASVLKST